MGKRARSAADPMVVDLREALWLSISPGMTVRRLRSTTRVSGPLCFSTSALLPTARMRSPLIANASATMNRSSTVTILPFSSTISARVCADRFAAGDGDGSKEKGTYDGAHDSLLEAGACHSIMPQTRVIVRAKLAVSAMDLGQPGTEPSLSIDSANHAGALVPSQISFQLGRSSASRIARRSA